MQFNIDFEVAAAVFETLFIIFFLIKRFLPTKQNRLYISACFLSLACVIFDCLTAYLDSNADKIPMGIIHVGNSIYFCLLPLLAFTFCIYCIHMVKQESILNSPLYGMLLLPLIISELISITNPFTGKLYYYEGSNYIHGDWYLFEFIANAIYIVFVLVLIVVYKSYISKIQIISTGVSASLLILGAVIQGAWFNNVLLTNAFSSLAMVVIYLSLQNPDMFLDRQSNMFNSEAFGELSLEYVNAGKTFSVIYFWIDDFKNLDALYGVDNVNAGLEKVIEYLNQVFSEKTLYRMDSSTFLIQEMGKGDYAHIERTIKKRFESAFPGINLDIMFSVSMIVVPYWQVPSDLKRLQRILEFSENLARETGFDSTIEVSDEIISKMEYENGVERAVERAIANNSIQVYCQPIFSTVEKKITSAEALSRLFDEELGFISPEVFIHKAEMNGSIIKLGSQIFEKVCIFLKDSNVLEYGLKSIHVNLSPIQCMQEDLSKQLIEITDRYGIDRNLIDLEITETSGIENNKLIIKNMDDLIAENFSFSLDDYGTGYSNTSTIVSLPFKAVKIDKSLVWSYFRKQSKFLPDIINMFHNLKLELIMEGVETQEMVEVLGEMGCQYLQGYYFSKPIPQREFVSYLREFNRKNL